MKSKQDEVRGAIADQAGEWFATNDAGSLDARQAADLAGWLKTSPLHVEEFLGVAVIARDMRELSVNPEYSIEALQAQARSEDDESILPFWRRLLGSSGENPVGGWRFAGVALAALAVVCVGALGLWRASPVGHVSAPVEAAVLRLETRHGEQLTHRLADNSVLHLNTDSAVTVRPGEKEWLVEVTSGEVAFDVPHMSERLFRVVAGGAEIRDLGTRFDVRLQGETTLVTVMEGQVAVGLAAPEEGVGSSLRHASQEVRLNADQQIAVSAGNWPATPASVDAQRSSAWLDRRIVFDREPMQQVAIEFNRYFPRQIEIMTPALKGLEISGEFATDDSEPFIAFLRSLDGVSVEVTATRIRVSQK